MVASRKPEGASEPRRGHLHLLRDDVAGVLAHDLKTPLAAIAINLDFALGQLGPDASPAIRGALEDCRESNDRAAALIADMVDAVRLGSGQQRPHIVPVDAQARLTVAVRRVAALAAARDVRVTWTAEPASILGDAELFDRAIERLLERALRHARAGGAVDVTLRAGSVVIRVSPSTDASLSDPPVQEVTMRSLATHFADAAMRAQGGAVWTEGDADGALLFVVALPS